MKKIWYLIWITIFIIVVCAGYLFLKQSNSQTIKMMLIFIGCVILARLVITPIVTIIIQRHDRLKEKADKERKENGE